ncbi:MAG TPA: energy transducer TonB [Planctomycetota bacterium]|nr:energy transducer TonB [Planctomycetota bacterium]
MAPSQTTDPARLHSIWPAIAAALAVNLGALLSLRLAHGRFFFDDSPDLVPVEIALSTPIPHLDNALNFQRPQPLETPFVLENKVPPELFDQFQPNVAKPNGLLDLDDGGTALATDPKRNGGGGGDAAQSPEFGHIETGDHVWARMKWKPDAGAEIVAAGDESGTGASIPGTLKAPGAGIGLGNGEGSGALASQGGGRGSGAGLGGSNSGTGLGTAPPLGLTRRPMLLSKVDPIYPESARLARHSGSVMLNVEVLPSGNVGEVTVQSSSGFSELDQAAVTAAKQYRFAGALKDGQPISFWFQRPFRFTVTVE